MRRQKELGDLSHPSHDVMLQGAKDTSVDAWELSVSL